jgi:hypothetical protein
MFALASEHPEVKNKSFSIFTTLPTFDLQENIDKTFAEANLLNSLVILRFT